MHLLMQLATRKPYRVVPEMPDSARYDARAGYWTIAGEPVAAPGGTATPALCTKKCDQETGEDLKGE